MARYLLVCVRCRNDHRVPSRLGYQRSNCMLLARLAASKVFAVFLNSEVPDYWLKQDKAATEGVNASRASLNKWEEQRKRSITFHYQSRCGRLGWSNVFGHVPSPNLVPRCCIHTTDCFVSGSPVGLCRWRLWRRYLVFVRVKLQETQGAK